MKINIFFICLVLCFSIAYSDSSVRIYTNNDLYLSSEPIGLSGVGNQWQSGKFYGGTFQIASLNSELGVNYNNKFKISTGYQQEYNVDFSPDTSAYYYGTQNNKLIPNKEYEIDLKANAYRAKTWKISKILPIKQAQITIGLKALEASGLQHGSIKGTSISNSLGNSDQYKAKMLYYYDVDRLLDRPDVIAPKGRGYALDLDAKVPINERLSVNAKVHDVAGVINWQHVPFTDADLTSGTKIIDDDGFIKHLPHLSGKIGYQSKLKQNLKPKIDIKANYRLRNKNYSIISQYRHNVYEDLVGIGFSKMSANSELSMSFWPQTKVVDMRYQYKNFFTEIGLQQFDFDRNRFFHLNLGYGYQ
jgi:hypothetical protein